MRVSDYLRFAWKAIWGQKTRSFLSILALAISAVILISLVTITLGAKRVISEELGLDKSYNTMIVTANTDVSTGILNDSIQIANQGAEKMADDTIEKVSNVSGVAKVTPLVSIWEFKRFGVEGSPVEYSANAVAVGSDVSLSIVAGTLPKAGNQVMIGSAFVEKMGYKGDPQAVIGKKVSITTQSGYRGVGAVVPGVKSTQAELEDFGKRSTELNATIVGVTDTANFRNKIVTSMNWANEIKTPQVLKGGVIILGENQIEKTGYNSLIVDARTSNDVKNVAQEIESIGLGVLSTQSQIERINSYLLVMWLVLGAIALVSMVMAGIGIVNTMLMTISEENYTISVWRACGASRRLIRSMYLLQSVLLGVIGGALGVLIGYIATLLLNNTIRSILDGQGFEGINVAVPSVVVLVGGFLTVLVLCVIAGLYPASHAAKQDPGVLMAEG